MTTSITLIPRDILNSKKINNYIDDVLSMSDVNSFEDLDDINQDMLISLGIDALGGDVDFVPSADCLASYLSSYKTEDLEKLAASMREQAYEYFFPIFDQLIEEHKANIKSYFMQKNGRIASVDQITGESIWL